MTIMPDFDHDNNLCEGLPEEETTVGFFKEWGYQ